MRTKTEEEMRVLLFSIEDAMGSLFVVKNFLASGDTACLHPLDRALDLILSVRQEIDTGGSFEEWEDQDDQDK